MIEKLLALILIMTYVIWSFTSQPTIPLEKLTQKISITKEKHFSNIHLSQEQFHNIIMSAGEKSGWIMTKFKSNSIIAEKIQKNDSLVVTIKFDKSSFSILPDNSELEGAITAMLHQ